MTTEGEIRVGPAARKAIEAELSLAVYRAARRARRQLLGLDPPPISSATALRLLRDGMLGESQEVPA